MEIIGQRVKVNLRGQRSNFQHGPLELKFTWNDPCDILNILKMHWRA